MERVGATTGVLVVGRAIVGDHRLPVRPDHGLWTGALTEQDDLHGVAACQAGFSVHPFSPAVVELVADDLAGLRSTKGGVQFTAERPVPDEVFDRMVAARRAEIDTALGTRR